MIGTIMPTYNYKTDKVSDTDFLAIYEQTVGSYESADLALKEAIYDLDNVRIYSTHYDKAMKYAQKARYFALLGYADCIKAKRDRLNHE